jgi:DNA-directed RNA polymerase specialized sigma24 family protein
MDYTFRELADIYGLSSPTIRKRYKLAEEALGKYVSRLSEKEKVAVQDLIREKPQPA